MGSVAQTARFRARLGLTFPCLADPDRSAYQAFGLTRGKLSQYAGIRFWWRGFKALFRGGVGKPIGDVAQMPGAFIIDRQGVLRLVHRSLNSADLPSLGEMIEICRGLSEASSPAR